MVFKRIIDEDQIEDGAPGDDFEKLLNDSYGAKDKKLNPGQKVRCEVLSVGKEFVIVSTGSVSDGFVPANLLRDADGKSTVLSGESLDLFVTHQKAGQTYLSPNPTERNLADSIQEAHQNNLSVEGKVLAVNKGGFDVEVMGKSAFCPISQMDSKRIDKPEDYIGKRFEFKVSQFTNGGRNIVVSRRKILENEQVNAQANFATERRPGDVVAGVVTRLEKFGAFVEIAPGLEGLAHISELSWSRVAHPSDVLETGAAVSAKILKIEQDGNRLKISLSLKQSENEPWLNLPDHLKAGSVVDGRITRCMNFGAFVELSPGIEGLIPLSELASGKRVASAEDVVKVGEVRSVLIKDINPQAKRISLSLKEAAERPSSEETADIKAFNVKQQLQSSASSFGTLGGKLQAALDRGGKKA